MVHWCNENVTNAHSKPKFTMSMLHIKVQGIVTKSTSAQKINHLITYEQKNYCVWKRKCSAFLNLLISNKHRIFTYRHCCCIKRVLSSILVEKTTFLAQHYTHDFLNIYLNSNLTIYHSFLETCRYTL